MPKEKKSTSARDLTKQHLVGFRAIQTKRLYQQIAEQIREQILRGELKPDSRLPSERELAETFNVSRPSVREAMISLEASGWVEVRVGEGTFVGSGKGKSHSFDFTSENTPGLLELFQSRRIIEPELAALAAKRVGEAEIRILSAAVDEAEKYFKRGELADDADYAFHVQLASYSGNMVLADVIRKLWELRTDPKWHKLRTRIANSEDRLDVIRRRRCILEALRNKNSECARAEMSALIEWVMNRYFGQEPED